MTAKDLLGRRLGPYHIEAILGSGGMAVVYRARRVEAGAGSASEPVALKVLFPPPGAGAELRARFEREARTAARLRHPAIVRVLEAGQAEGYAYMAMSLVEGHTLAARLAQGPALDEAAAANIAWQIADALDYAHRQGVVHRDIKPSNILLSAAGRAWLTDFGVAQALDDPALTRAGHTVGTPVYMAPEQAGGGQPVDGRADLYALGVVLYQMVTGRTPFQGSTPQVLHAQVYQPPPAPSTVAAVSPAMEAIIMRALTKDTARRFQTGAAMAQALAGLEGPTGTQARLSLPAQPGSPLKRLVLWLGLIPLLLILGFLIWQFSNFDFKARLNTALPTLSPTLTETAAPALSPSATATFAPILGQVPPPTPITPPTPTTAPSPTPSATLPPAPTFTPLPPASPTPSPSATSCPQPVDSALAALPAADRLDQPLGCPRSEALTVSAAWQPFQHGQMLWREDSKVIYILGPGHTWSFTGDPWREGDPSEDPAFVPPETGLYQPVRGFGQVWRERTDIRDALGWGLAEEDGFEALIQEFDNAQVWLDRERQTFYILFNDRTYNEF